MNILVYGNWRTGSNLLINIFTELGFYDFNEYYSLTGVTHCDLPESEKLPVIQRSNDYLLSLMAPPRDKFSVLKVNFPHTHLPSSDVLARFDIKMLIYRTDFLRTAFSKIIAEDRRSWNNIGGLGQPQYNKSINISEMSVALAAIQHHTKRFIANRSRLTIDHVVNYENDLIPYIKLNGSRHYPSDNYNIINREEIEDWYENSSWKKVSTTFKEYFDDLKIKTNTNTFTEFVENIKNKKLNENK